jgi:hypothetical protein
MDARCPRCGAAVHSRLVREEHSLTAGGPTLLHSHAWCSDLRCTWNKEFSELVLGPLAAKMLNRQVAANRAARQAPRAKPLAWRRGHRR